MKVETKDLIGPALDWAVAQVVDLRLASFSKKGCFTEYVEDHLNSIWKEYSPSTKWKQGGSIVDYLIDSGFELRKADFGQGMRFFKVSGVGDEERHIVAYGETILIAACRCYIFIKLGHYVHIPEELV